MNIENWDDREAVDNVGNNRDKIQQTDDKEVIKDEKKWEVPDLKTLTKEDFKGVKKIEFVVHPLYRFLFESQLNAETQYIDGDFDQILLHCFNKLCGEDSKIDHVNVCLGPAFLTLMEMVEEIQDYMKPIQEGTIRVFLMPNISELNENQRLIMNKFLNKYGGKNIYTLNSQGAGNGVVNYDDRNFLVKNLPEEVDIEIQGGYMSGCLDGAIESFNDIRKYGKTTGDVIVKLKIDLISSTDPRIQTGSSINKVDEFVIGTNLKPSPQDKLPESFNSVSEAIDWLKNSSSYKNFENSKYRKMLAELYKKELDVDSILDNLDNLDDGKN